MFERERYITLFYFISLVFLVFFFWGGGGISFRFDLVWELELDFELEFELEFEPFISAKEGRKKGRKKIIDHVREKDRMGKGGGEEK